MDTEGQRFLPESELQVHLAEYAALTTRCTYWLAFLVPIWTALIVFLTLVAVIWKELDPIIRIWGTGLGAQAIVFMWFQTIEEQYIATDYILTEIKPHVSKLTGFSKFWTYESRSAGRDDALNWWGEWICPFLTMVGLVIVLLAPWLMPGTSVATVPRGFLYWLGFILNGAMLWIQMRKTRTRIRLRQAIASVAPPPSGG